MISRPCVTSSDSSLIGVDSFKKPFRRKAFISCFLRLFWPFFRISRRILVLFLGGNLYHAITLLFSIKTLFERHPPLPSQSKREAESKRTLLRKRSLSFITFICITLSIFSSFQKQIKIIALISVASFPAPSRIGKEKNS